MMIIMEDHGLSIVNLTFNMLLLLLGKKKTLLKLLCYYYILGQNEWTYFPGMTDDHGIIIHSDKIAVDTNSVSAPQQNIFSTFIPSILLGHIFASSDQIILKKV